MGFFILVQNNVFDYGIKYRTNGLQFYMFSEVQLEARKFKEGTLHKMCNVQGFGSLDFRPIIKQHIVKIKVYQILCHEILSMIQRQMLKNDMPTIMRIMRIRFS